MALRAAGLVDDGQAQSAQGGDYAQREVAEKAAEDGRQQHAHGLPYAAEKVVPVKKTPQIGDVQMHGRSVEWRKYIFPIQESPESPFCTGVEQSPELRL